MNSEIEQQLAQLGIEAYLERHHHKSLLRFLTCGSVDDGKSTLIGRLLHDAQQIYEDQLAAIHIDSQKVGTTGEKPDLALLVDGLQAEREQGITIDVAYRYFSTQKRKFIIADTPGHEQYTRNMATGASTSSLAVILIDARKGVLTQTCRHSYIASLLGIAHFVVAVNKMDLVAFDPARFEEIKKDYLSFAKKLSTDIDIQFVPVSALEGDNVVARSIHMPWYEGDTLLGMLESVDIHREKDKGVFRFPVQYVNRSNSDFRGFSGTVASGTVHLGDEIKVLPSGQVAKVARVVTFDGDLDCARAGQAVTLTLDQEIDISRGDLLVSAGHDQVPIANVLASIVWMAEAPLEIGRQYDIKVAGKKTVGWVSKIRHQVDINAPSTSDALGTFDADALPLNGIAECEVELAEKVLFSRYQDCRDTGGFILIDRLTNVTVGAGMVTALLDSPAKPASVRHVSDFEIELNALVRKHFPDWNARDIRKLLE